MTSLQTCFCTPKLMEAALRNCTGFVMHIPNKLPLPCSKTSMQCLPPSWPAQSKNPKGKGSGIVWGLSFFRLGIFLIYGSVHFPCYSQHFEPGNCHFHCICSTLDFEPFLIHNFCIIFMESAAFWRWNLSFQRFWILHDCSTVFIDFSTVFIDSYMVVIDFFEVSIDFW